MTTHVLFDFFGTLVSYSPSRTRQGFHRCHALMPGTTYESFLARLDACFTTLDRAADTDDREFSMAQAAAALLGEPVTSPRVAQFERTYLAEWSAPVTVPDGLRAFLVSLRRRHRLAVVSNTHSPTMVPDLLAAHGLDPLFDTVVLSVEVGRRKPHPAPYRTALSRLGAAAADAVFVGDSYVADYAGPTAAGIPAYLIDPACTADIPADRRLHSVFDLGPRLGVHDQPV